MSRIGDILARLDVQGANAKATRQRSPNKRLHATPKQTDDEFPSEFKEDKFPHSSPQREIAKMMHGYCHKLLWTETDDVIDARRQVQYGILRIAGDSDGRRLIAKAHNWAAKVNSIIREAVQKREITNDIKSKLIALGGSAYAIAQKRLESIVHFGSLEPSGKPALPPLSLSKLGKRKINRISYAPHPNDIFGLKPATSWKLYIDESGTDFSSEGDGVIAGVLSDASQPLPPQPKLHAMTDTKAIDIRAADKLVKTLINHPNTGVIAIPARAYAAATNWAAGVASLIDIVLRLLPLDANGKKTTLEVFVEIHGAYNKAENFLFIREACLFNLARTFPVRANTIKLKIKTMDKGCSHNAYPDIVANACHTALTNAKGFKHDRLASTGWEGTCFLNYEPGAIEKLFDDFRSGRQLDGPTWDRFLSSRNSSHGIISAMLARFGEEAREFPEVWNGYLSWTINHLESKAIDLWKLSSQIEWLERYRPGTEKMPKRLQLVWKTVSLAQSNHMGGVLSTAEYAEVKNLAAELYEEDAPLACWATLHLAVAETNAFRFNQAKKIVEDYLKLIRSATWGVDVPQWLKKPAYLLFPKLKLRSWSAAAIPGLCYYGQLMSTYGQHYAFLGDNDTAINYFNEAIRTFQRLSDPKEAQKEIQQTKAYLVAAKMDSRKVSDAEARQTLEDYLQADPCDAARQLATCDGNDRKYHHHVILRYMFSGRPCNNIKSAYCENTQSWAVADGHPWELIECYRAMLCNDLEEKARHFRVALRISDVGDATLQVIALVILGCLVSIHKATRAEYNTKMDKVLKLVPDLGAKRIATLRAQPDKRLPPENLLRTVLPFNFR